MPSVLCISGCKGATYRYRVEHLRESLRYGGWRVTESDADLLLLHRVPWNDEIDALIANYRSRGKPVVFDIDDLLFAKNHVSFLHASDYELERRDRTLAIALGHARTLSLCTGALASTDFLHREIYKAFPDLQVVTVRNTVSAAMMQQAEDVLGHPRDADGNICIGYLSGTPSHDLDFLACARALFTCMILDERVKLIIVGYLTLPSYFDAVASRVKRIPFVDWQELPLILKTFDINLAPLELGNPFTEAKSDIKYLEAALMKVPTIASANESYRRAIRNGVNGFACTNEDEWHDALTRLIKDAPGRKSLGEEAHADVLAHATTMVHGRECATLLSSFFSPLRSCVA